MLQARRPIVLAAFVALVGCDKLKSTLGKGDDGGAAPSGGGVLSFLGSDFEGEIAANVSSKGKAQLGTVQQVVFGIKKPKYRVDTTGGGPSGSFIIDSPAKKAYALNHPQKTAMVIDLEKMKSIRQLPGVPNAPKGVPSTVPTAPPTIDKTGKKDVVAGYTCEIWKITSEGKKAEACVAEGITWIDLADLGMSSPEIAIAAFATEANRFPLRVISFDAKGAEETRMEATKIEKKKLDDARFAVPPDYRVMDMSALGSMLPGMPSALPRPKR